LGGDFVYNLEKERVIFTLPDSLVNEVDKIVKTENTNREEFAQAAFQFYITQKKKTDLKEVMIKGYKEMGQINLALAELGMTSEVSSNEYCEGKIAQGEY
jgi:CopG family transcriptional regulator/antitoxin EndoAI